LIDTIITHLCNSSEQAYSFMNKHNDQKKKCVKEEV